MENEQIISPEEELEQLEQKRKVLKEKVFKSRETKLKEAKEARAERDVKIEQNNEKLNKIQTEIYAYKKMGKVEKDDFDIFGKIVGIIQEDIFVGSETKLDMEE